MTLPRTLTTLFLAIAFLIQACGGTETDVSDEPVDVADTTEHTEDALKSGGGGSGFSSCSYPTFTCYNEKGQVTGVSTGCSILCYNQTAMCWPGTCNGRITIDASCSCWAF